MAMAVLPVHPSTSTSTSTSTSASTSSFSCTMGHCDSYAGDLHSVPNEDLWNDIDLAERCLVSSQFDEAVTLSSNLLKRLRDLQDNFEGIQDESEVDDMIESSGMVLIQAYNESGSSSIMLNELGIIFGSLSKVPPRLFFSGVCLQISAGMYSDAQGSIELYLKDWTFTALNAQSCRFKEEERTRQGSAFLKPEMYLNITELYCVEVLSKGLGNIDAALLWLRDVTDIPADRRESILETIERLSLEKDKRQVMEAQSNAEPDGASSLLPSVSGYPSVVSGSIENDIKMHIQKTVDSDSFSPSFHPFALFELISRWMYSRVHSSSSQSGKVLGILSQQKMSFAGVAVVFLMVALYRQKHSISRIVKSLGMRTLLHAIYVGLHDLWRLAFNVQLNPLAVVQP